MGAITHVGLAVPDLERAIDYYSKVFGFYVLAGPFKFNEELDTQPHMTKDLFGPEVKKMRNVHLMSSGGVGIELFEFQKPSIVEETPSARSGFFHICLIVEDLVETIERIVLHGGKQTSRIWNLSDDKPYYMVYTTDPFGHIIELYSRSTSEIFGGQ
ncbi:VOC family protein [Planococcus sp. YIM B11945]|uniref:VOC family protein n=1 Tax=Planococcus sp. YIM B11945 TaxID=3435410 RepID=UPI003D7DB426